MLYRIKKINTTYENTAEGGFCDFPIKEIINYGDFEATSRRKLYNMIRKEYDSNAVFTGVASNWIIYDENELMDINLNK